VVVFAVVDDSLSPTSPLGDGIDTFLRREDAEHSSRRSAATIRSSPAVYPRRGRARPGRQQRADVEDGSDEQIRGRLG
jgi:hypothetical protein